MFQVWVSGRSRRRFFHFFRCLASRSTALVFVPWPTFTITQCIMQLQLIVYGQQSRCPWIGR